MHRFYLSNLPAAPETLSLTGCEATHAAKVLRLQPGNDVTVLNGRGLRILARIQDVRRNHVALETLHIEQAAQPTFEITLFQALTKPKSMDWLIEKATELGVRRIQPILTERVVSKLGERDGPRKMEKWQRTAIEALKQCGSLWLPDVASPCPLSQAMDQAAVLHCHMLASLSPDAKPVRHSFDALTPPPSSAPVQVGIWIGPEGNFSTEEIARLQAAGAISITLGQNVLRSETAAICALALIGDELGLRFAGGHNLD